MYRVRGLAAVTSDSLGPVLEQGCFSAAQLAVGVTVARLLGVESFGVFGVAMSVQLLLLAVHTGSAQEPSVRWILGTGDVMERQRRTGAAFLVSTMVALVVGMAGAGLSAIAVGFHGSYLWPLLAAGIGFPGVALFWHFRRVAVASGSWQKSLAAVGSYFLLLMLGMTALFLVERLSPSGAIVVTAIASGVAGLGGVFILGVRGPARVEFLACGRVYFSYARLGALAGPLTWVPGQSITLVLSTTAGPEIVGLYRALLLMLQPGWQTITAVTTRLWGRIAARPDLARTLTGRFSGVLVLVGASYGLLIAMGAPWLMPALLGSTFSYSIPLVAVTTLLASIAMASSLVAAMRAIGKPGRILAGYGVSTLLLGLILLVGPPDSPEAAISIQAVVFTASILPMLGGLRASNE